MKLTIDNETFRYLNAFGTLTGVIAQDCFELKEEIVYVVEPGKIGVAVGKGGANIKKVEGLLNKKIRLVEYSEDPNTFIRNVIFPLKVKNVYISTKSSGEKVINIQADVKLKKALMRNGKKLYKLLTILVGRHFPSYGVGIVDTQ
ncbi:MAG: NusA-like transcription termination signal-binding factor [Candidatus Altiarchaeota archaeon]|nr:NusA-like transcription termination signal-binding factor [Candidatus Altiarchaeota archaeon]